MSEALSASLPWSDTDTKRNRCHFKQTIRKINIVNKYEVIMNTVNILKNRNV